MSERPPLWLAVAAPFVLLISLGLVILAALGLVWAILTVAEQVIRM